MGLIRGTLVWGGLFVGAYAAHEYVWPALGSGGQARVIDETKKMRKFAGKVGTTAKGAAGDALDYATDVAKDVAKDTQKKVGEISRDLDDSMHATVFRDKVTGEWRAVKWQATVKSPVVITEHGYQVTAKDVTGRLTTTTFAVDYPTRKESHVVGSPVTGIVISNPAKIDASIASLCGEGVSPGLDCEALGSFLSRGLPKGGTQISLPGTLGGK